MQVHYPVGSHNVGDELNAWLWPHLLGDVFDEDIALLGVGTLLNEAFSRRLSSAKRILVMGTGAGYGPIPSLDDRWKFYAVRGVRTARYLGLSDNLAVADAAYLLSSLDWPRSSSSRRRVVVVPHHRSLGFVDWAALCRDAGLIFVSPLLPANEFLRALSGADLVLSEAMHGAILADILRVPWSAFSFGRQFNADKWSDWSEMFALSLSITEFSGFYDPACSARGRSFFHHASTRLKAEASRAGLGKAKWARVTPVGWPLGAAKALLVSALVKLSHSDGQLSSDRVIKARTDLLYERLNLLRHDLGLKERGALVGDPFSFFRVADNNL